MWRSLMCKIKDIFVIQHLSFVPNPLKRKMFIVMLVFLYNRDITLLFSQSRK